MELAPFGGAINSVHRNRCNEKNYFLLHRVLWGQVFKGERGKSAAETRCPFSSAVRFSDVAVSKIRRIIQRDGSGNIFYIYAYLDRNILKPDKFLMMM